MRNILSFKHWHLFLLIVVAGAWVSPEPIKSIVNAVSLITFLIWIYAIGVFGQEKIEQLGLPARSMKLFKINIVIIPTILVLVEVLVFAGDDLPDPSLAVLAFAVLMILYLFFAIFQIMIFAARTLTTIELSRPATFGDSLGNFVMMLFLFVGIWFLQPKINRFIAEDEFQVIES